MIGWVIAGASFGAAALVAVASVRAPYRKAAWGNRWGEPDPEILRREDRP